MSEEFCANTLDLEEYINKMAKTKTKAIITAHYKSGRIEEFGCNLKNSEELPKKYADIVSDLKGYPMVESVKIEKY